MDSEPNALPAMTRRDQIHNAVIDGQVLKLLTEAGLIWLRTNQQMVNALNVFPVPDGDTGTNMVLTMQAAYDEIANSAEHNLGKMAHAVAHGALMGARGNSGVILSQVWRGFARALDNQEILDGPSLARAFAQGRDTAYKGVVRPVEGTILTVIKDAATEAELTLHYTDDPYQILERILLAAEQSVLRTPDLLPVLREAGVVDAGGKGLFFILEGMLRYIHGLPLDVKSTPVQPLAAMDLEHSLDTIEPGQDYEIIIDFRPATPLVLEQFYESLEEMGTSIQIGEDERMYRLHIHVPSEKKHTLIDYIDSLGTVIKYTVENLLVQMDEIQKNSTTSRLSLDPVVPGQIAVVAVAPGEGIAKIFASLKAAAIVEGGQTMNPSTQEIIHAFENLPTDKIIILPNNKNIILAAQNAAQLTVKKIAVIPCKSVPQGLAAILRLIPDGDFNSVVEEMMEAIQEVETGEITTATRSVEIDGVEVKEGQIIALHNGKLVLAASSLEEACLELLGKAGAASREIITLFYGDTLSRGEINRIADIIRSAYPEQEVEVQEGGQPHYQFIISIE
jgi:uncharacterized protein